MKMGRKKKDQVVKENKVEEDASAAGDKNERASRKKTSQSYRKMGLFFIYFAISCSMFLIGLNSFICAFKYFKCLYVN